MIIRSKLIFLPLILAGCATGILSQWPSFNIRSCRFLDSVWNQGHAEAFIVSQDGGAPVATPKGSLWWFGDTFKGSRDDSGIPHFKGGGVSCSVAFLEKTDKTTPPVLKFLLDKDKTAAQAIGFLPGETWERHRIWPLAGFYINHKSYIYYSLIELTGEGKWGFKGIGSGLAWSKKPLAIHKRILNSDKWRFPVSPSAIILHDNWLYLYDVEKRGDQQGIWLSRVRPQSIENPDAYRFYCGEGPKFSANKNQQVRLMGDVYGQTSVVWNEYLGLYVLASSSNIYFPRSIYFYTAKTPYGPWGRPCASIKAPKKLQGKEVELLYCAFFHPELFHGDGEKMNLTFSLHLKDSGFDVNNGMVEIKIEKILER